MGSFTNVDGDGNENVKEATGLRTETTVGFTLQAKLVSSKHLTQVHLKI